MLQSGLVTDADIDAIIAKGEQETAELNNKLQEYTENAMKFTMDGGACPAPLLVRYELILEYEPAQEPVLALQRGMGHLLACTAD